MMYPSKTPSPRTVNLKLYSEEDKKGATKFLEMERMEHHNVVCKEMSRSNKFDSWGVQAKKGFIDVAWTKKNYLF